MKFPSLASHILKPLLLPIVRAWLRHGNALQDLIDAAKELFITAAEEELRRGSEKINTSRLSVLTGMRRSEVQRVLKARHGTQTQSRNLLARIVGQWRHDNRFASSPNTPRSLTYSGNNSEFKALCQNVSKHLKPGTVIFELERQGLAERKDGKVFLLKQVYGVQLEPEKAYQFVGGDIEYLLQAIQENLFLVRPNGNLHIRTEYDNIYQSDIPAIRRWLIDEGKLFHRKAREFLAQFDKDVKPGRADPAGAKVVVEAFSITNPAGLEEQT
jgi:hypothetical protein